MLDEVTETVKEKLYQWVREQDLQGWVHPTWHRRCTPLQDRYCLVSHETKLFKLTHKYSTLEFMDAGREHNLRNVRLVLR